jgi:hypothetical protein
MSALPPTERILPALMQIHLQISLSSRIYPSNQPQANLFMHMFHWQQPDE